MTATSLAGRRLRDELQQRAGEVDAALALGFPRRDAVLEVARPVASTALEAGAAQLLALVGLLAAEAIAVWVVTEQFARGPLDG
jgi:putative ABC transport system permease protein